MFSLRPIPGRPPHIQVKRPDERRSLSRSATRALDVLEHFGEERRWLRAIEISKLLGSTPSSTNQLLKTMVEASYLVFDAKTKSYYPSLRLSGFGAMIGEAYGSGEPLRLLVRRLHASTGLSVTLTTRNDLFMQILDLALPAGSRTERGLRISLFGSAIGSAYLSMIDAATLAFLVERARIASDDLPRLNAGLEQIRQDGFADGQSADRTFWTIALPLPPRDQPVPLVLALAGPVESVRPMRLELMALAKAGVSALDGGGGD